MRIDLKNIIDAVYKITELRHDLEGKSVITKDDLLNLEKIENLILGEIQKSNKEIGEIRNTLMNIL